MNEVRAAAVLGLGLVGGSIARELAGKGVRVLGADRDARTVRQAVREGVVSQPLDESLDGLEGADLVMLAVPVAAAVDLLEAAAPHLNEARLITDAGSTKSAVVRAAERLGLGDRFVGAHPLAGDHASGWAASRTGLFEGAPVYLCPTTTSHPDAVKLARELWSSLGARLEVIGAGEHDRRLAWTSHLPQAASTALALTLTSAGVHLEALGPGGRDATRLAGSHPEMWTGIAEENAVPLSQALLSLEGRLRELREELDRGDGAAVRRFFAAGRRWAEGDGTEP